MRRTSVFLAACLTLALLPARAQTPDTLRFDLEAAIQRALEASPEIAAAESNLDFAQARHRLARASRFATEFSLQTAHSMAPGLRNLPEGIPHDELYLHPEIRNDWSSPRPLNRFEASLVQPLHTWGELGGTIEAAGHGTQVEAAAVEQKRIEIALRTGELYYSLLLAEELVRLAEKIRDIVERAGREIQRLLDEGAEDVDDADLFKVRITEQEFQRRLVEANQGLQTARSALRHQLMLSEAIVLEPESSVLEPIPFVLDSLATYLDAGLEHRPEIDRALAGLATREAQIQVARSGYYPKIFLGIDMGITLAQGRIRQPTPYVGDPYRGRSIRAGIGLRLPLNMAQTRAKVEQARAERNEVHHQLAAVRRLILFEVESAYRNVLVTRTSMEAHREALNISKEWLRTEQINFDLDLGDTENLVDAVRSNLELEASYYEQVRTYDVAVLRLHAATGMPGRRIPGRVLPE